MHGRCAHRLFYGSARCCRCPQAQTVDLQGSPKTQKHSLHHCKAFYCKINPSLTFNTLDTSVHNMLQTAYTYTIPKKPSYHINIKLTYLGTRWLSKALRAFSKALVRRASSCNIWLRAGPGSSNNMPSTHNATCLQHTTHNATCLQHTTHNTQRNNPSTQRNTPSTHNATCLQHTTQQSFNTQRNMPSTHNTQRNNPSTHKTTCSNCLLSKSSTNGHVLVEC